MFLFALKVGFQVKIVHVHVCKCYPGILGLPYVSAAFFGSIGHALGSLEEATLYVIRVILTPSLNSVYSGFNIPYCF